MAENYKPTFKHYATILGALILGYAGLNSIAKHDESRYEIKNPTCVNQGNDEKRAVKDLKAKLRSIIKDLDNALDE